MANGLINCAYVVGPPLQTLNQWGLANTSLYQQAMDPIPQGGGPCVQAMPDLVYAVHLCPLQ